MALKQFTRVMKALSDPNRVKILKMLQRKMMCVCEIQASLDIAQPTVSKHLKVLEDAGLVGFQKSGQWVNYHLAEASDNPYSATLLDNLSQWLLDDPEVKRLMAAVETANREVICRK
ncbi:MAG: ArsR/SmtB family transcription factor [Acidobacteriota bacterium]